MQQGLAEATHDGWLTSAMLLGLPKLLRSSTSGQGLA